MPGRWAGMGQVLASTMPRTQNRAAKGQLSSKSKTEHFAQLRKINLWSRLKRSYVSNMLHTYCEKSTLYTYELYSCERAQGLVVAAAAAMLPMLAATMVSLAALLAAAAAVGQAAATDGPLW